MKKAKEDGRNFHPVFKDKVPEGVKKKHVFRIWKEYIWNVPEKDQYLLKFTDLCKIYPEHKDRLILWNSCCDDRGMVVSRMNP